MRLADEYPEAEGEVLYGVYLILGEELLPVRDGLPNDLSNPSRPGNQDARN